MYSEPVTDGDVVITRFQIQSLIDAFYQSECKWSKTDCTNAFIREEDLMYKQ